jgi:hypothetical protein
LERASAWRKRFVTGRCRIYRRFAFLEETLQRFAGIGVVVDDEHANTGKLDVIPRPVGVLLGRIVSITAWTRGMSSTVCTCYASMLWR